MERNVSKDRIGDVCKCKGKEYFLRAWSTRSKIFSENPLELIPVAVLEHVSTGRIVIRDAEDIRFGEGDDW